jgi:STE24 endopeptidase
VLYAAIRWAGERWWGCGVAASVAVLVLAILVGPVWIDPLFNTYRPVEAGEVKDAVLTMARANAVPVDSVYVFDASRQTTRVSANVSGILGTAAIRLVGGPGDVASLPLLAAVLSALAFLATPVVNGIIRAQEIEADRFGLNLAGEPHGEAEVDLKLTDYRKPDPGSVEELLFFDHPSTRFRVHEAMRWREAMSGSDPR